MAARVVRRIVEGMHGGNLSGKVDGPRRGDGTEAFQLVGGRAEIGNTRPAQCVDLRHGLLVDPDLGGRWNIAENGFEI
jgi:hypothetical protein